MVSILRAGKIVRSAVQSNQRHIALYNDLLLAKSQIAANLLSIQRIMLDDNSEESKLRKIKRALYQDRISLYKLLLQVVEARNSLIFKNENCTLKHIKNKYDCHQLLYEIRKAFFCTMEEIIQTCLLKGYNRILMRIIGIIDVIDKDGAYLLSIAKILIIDGNKLVFPYALTYLDNDRLGELFTLSVAYKRLDMLQLLIATDSSKIKEEFANIVRNISKNNLINNELALAQLDILKKCLLIRGPADNDLEKLAKKVEILEDIYR